MIAGVGFIVMGAFVGGGTPGSAGLVAAAGSVGDESGVGAPALTDAEPESVA